MFLLLAVIAVGVTSCGTDEELDERKSNIARIIEVTRLIPEGFGVEDYQQGDILTSDNPFVAEVLETKLKDLATFSFEEGSKGIM